MSERQGIFVVHEHHASRLHYDFRLGVHGVLKSWAVPKGPSMNPSEKRFGVMVDDHPLSYASFEGIIPQGYYGVGPVVVWDQGTYGLPEDSDPAEGLDKGALSFVLHGQRLRGAFSLVKLKGRRSTGKEWLLMKRLDQYADPNFSLTTALTAGKQRALKNVVPSCQVA